MRFPEFILALSFCFFFFACGEEEENNMYGKEVFFEVDARSGGPDNNLNSAGHYKTFEQPRKAKDRGLGLGGLLVVCSGEILEGSSFYYLYAYDLACPHERVAHVKIKPQTNMRAKCPECESEYDLFSGRVLSGKSQNNLVRYQARPESQTPGVFIITR